MRHAKGYRILNRTHEHRKALWANMAGSLIEHEQIKTTLPKAKFLKPQADKIITLGKKDSLHNTKMLVSQLQYIKSENIDLPSLYFSHQRDCVLRDGVILANSEFIKLKPGEEVVNMTIRYRTCGDMPITGAVESQADDLTKIIEEVATARTTERGGRADDKRAETAMEDRKKQGYF